MELSSTQHAELRDAAVRNNAVWCDAVCRAHELPTAADSLLWRCLGTPPPFYPSAVTVADQAPSQLALIKTLVAAGLPDGWAIKDSYAALDLAPLGFGELFAATWIGLAPDQPLPDSAGELRWSTVGDAATLARWEAAWRGEPGNSAASPSERVFRPVLLHDAAIRIIAGWRGDAIVAGAIANQSGAVVGVSNLFLPADQSTAIRAGAVAAVRAQFPGLALVGYEAGDDLAAMREVGFAELGPLRIWLRPGDG